MRSRKIIESFNLAFLDIMSCGLGAVILILMLVKFDPEIDLNAPEEVVSTQTQQLRLDIKSLSEHATNLQQTLIDLDAQYEKQLKQHIVTEQKVQKLRLDVQAKQATLSQKQQNIDQSRTKLEELTKQRVEFIEKKIKQQSESQKLAKNNIQTKGKETEQYLLGLSVEGKRIGLLIDASASMTDEKLIDIIARKIKKSSDKKAGPKWIRTKRIINWLLSNIPESSEFSVVFYNQEAHMMGPKQLMRTTQAQDIAALQKNIDDFIPENATNLAAGLRKMKEINPAITNLYIVTDGLPTQGSSTVFSRCVLNRKTISGECRQQLLQSAVKESFGANVPVSIVLLPMEGDPQAANMYWQWAFKTQGILMTPAPSWP